MSWKSTRTFWTLMHEWTQVLTKLTIEKLRLNSWIIFDELKQIRILMSNDGWILNCSLLKFQIIWSNQSKKNWMESLIASQQVSKFKGKLKLVRTQKLVGKYSPKTQSDLLSQRNPRSQFIRMMIKSQSKMLRMKSLQKSQLYTRISKTS